MLLLHREKHVSLFIHVVIWNSIFVSPSYCENDNKINNENDELIKKNEIPFTNFNKIINNIDFEKYIIDDKPEDQMTTIEMIRKCGYPAEIHYVVTEDGYILELHRIPNTRNSTWANSRPILMHHSLLESSYAWFVLGCENSIPYWLVNANYDVWLTNSRGNAYSKNHTRLTPSDREFWNFSWHEIGIYDLPATINYISKIVGNKKLYYMGHSMGTTVFFVMASEKPEILDKVQLMVGLAPVAHTGNILGTFRVLGRIVRKLEKMNLMDGHFEFFAKGGFFHFASKYICNQIVLRDMCALAVFLTVGFNQQQLNMTRLPSILHHTPAGTSMKTFLHYAQGIESNRFRQYDYGSERNYQLYSNKEPTDYNLRDFEVPVGLFWAENDYLSDSLDVYRLRTQIKNLVEFYTIPDKKFNHLDFYWSDSAPRIVYSRVIEFLNKY